MGYLYVTDSSAHISYESRYVTVKYKDGMIHKSPVETLESISIFGRSQVTTQCIQECLFRGIPITYYSSGGSYFGRLISTGHVNTERQRKQANFIYTEQAMELSKKIIKSKIHNQSVVLQRYSRSRGVDLSQELKQIKIFIGKIETCTDIPQLMGYEGSAARVYFEALGKLVEPEFAFSGRSKRPPKDAFNSMLSLGYSLLMNEFYGKIENKGLNPYFGFMHQDHEKHPTLASDLMEEWRAVIVDSLVMSLINGHEISQEHFYTLEERPGVFITKDGLKIFLKKLENKMRVETQYIQEYNIPVSFRRAMEIQVNNLTHVIEESDVDRYQPVWIR